MDREQIMEDVERQMRDEPLPSQVAFVSETLGRRTTAYLFGLSDLATVTNWAAGKREPSSGFKRDRVRHAFFAVSLLTRLYDPVTAEGWLFSRNPRFNGRAPAWVLNHSEAHDALSDVAAAAVQFAFGDALSDAGAPSIAYQEVNA